MSTNTSTKSILQLATPIILTGIAEPLINATDLSLIGQRIPGGISAVGLGSSATLAIVWISSALLNPISARAGYFLGQDETEKIKALTHWFTIRLLLFFIVLSVGLYLMAPQIIQLYAPKDKSVLDMSIDFLKVRILGLPFLLGSILFFQVFKGMQNTKIAFYITLIAGGVNLLGDFLLIDGLWIFPTLGIKGAALASSISHIIMFGLSLLYAFHLKLFTRINHSLKLNLNSLFTNSFNLLIRTILLNTTLFLGNKITAQQSDLHLELHTILSNLFLITAFFLDGVAGSASAISSKLNGENNAIAIRSVCFKSIIINLIFSFIFCGLLFFFHPILLSIYSSSDNLTPLLKPILIFYLLTIAIGSISFTMDGIFVGIEEVAFLRTTLIIATILGYCLPLFLTQHYTLQGVWVALFCWMTLRAILPFIKFISSF